MVGYFRNYDILKIGCFWQNPKIHENWRFENWLFWPFSISNLCHRQTIRDRSMKPIANNSLGSQFLQEKSPMWKYQPIFERTPWPYLAVQNSKFAVHDCPGWRCLCLNLKVSTPFWYFLLLNFSALQWSPQNITMHIAKH